MLLLAVLILAIPVVARASNWSFVSNGKESLGFTYYPTKDMPNIGWEADNGGYIRFVQYKNFYLGFKGDIRVISRDRPFGVDFDTINFNLVPFVGYAINDNQEINFGWYYWSEHFYHNRPVGNINMANLTYDKLAVKGSPDEIHFMFADCMAYNNYPLTWLTELSYGRTFVSDYIEPVMSLDFYRYNRRYMELYDIAFKFRPAKNNSVALSVGYKFGDAPIILFQPKGIYLGLILNW